MRSLPSSRRSVPVQRRPVSRRLASPLLRRVAGGAALVVLTLLYWIFFYQNLPDNPLAVVDPNQLAAAPVETGNTVDRIVKLVMLAFSASVIISKWSLARQVVKNGNPGLLIFMVLAPLSALWSIDPTATLLRFTTMAAVILLCFAISLAGFDRLRLQRVALPPVICILGISLILGMFYPDQMISTGDDLSLKDAWHGITLSKNQFGMMSSVGVIFCLNLWLGGSKRKMWAISGTGIAVTCLLLSRSNTSLLATIMGVAAMVALMKIQVVRQRFSTLVVVGVAATVLLYQLVIQDVIPGVSYLLAPVTGLTGKDTTFSSRTLIWMVIKEHISHSPLLGSGFGAYWTGPFESSPSYIFMYLMYFYPTESHNGYLEMMNDLGIVGLACLLTFLIWYMRQGLHLYRHDRSQASLYLALLFQQLVMNMSESEWFSRTSTFAILLLASFCMSRSLFEHRAQLQQQQRPR